MKYLVLIQARMGSSRLPGKVMKNIAGKPDVQWVLERVARSKRIDGLMLITSVDKKDIPLIHFVSGLGYRVFVGSEDDVLDRYYQAAKLFQPEYVIRITADCPLFDWRYLDQAIEMVEKDETIDYLGELSQTFPDGLDIEVIKWTALKTSWEKARLQSEREHVTMYVKNHPEAFTLKDLVCPISNIADERWTLDEADDFTLIESICQHFVSKGNEAFVTEDILEYLKTVPQIAGINKHIARNEGLEKSIRNDHIVTVL